METKTITAIATPLGTGGVGVIRLSGSKSLEIAKKLFVPFSKNTKFEPRKMIFGRIVAPNWSDDCLLVYFNAPNSFTGEDVVEIQMHGGVFLLQQTLKLLIENGATMAEPGEFSKRAMINGKMDITQAEGLIDMINAQSEAEMKIASSHVRGALKEKLISFQNKLTDFIARIEVALDHPEHEDAESESQIFADLPKLITEIEKLENTNQLGAMVKAGVNVALLGKPNVGKSSLLNALLGYDRAIVTDIAGTTRDTISESYQFNGVRFNVVDTAGLQSTLDIVEKEGINRSLKQIEQSDIVIFITDDEKFSLENINFEALTPQFFAGNRQKFLFVLNKIDTKKDVKNANFDLCISAKNNTNVNELKQLIYDKTINKSLLSNQEIITNARQSKLLKDALANLYEAQKAVGIAPLDCIAINIKQAWDLIGQITGTTSNETIIDTIFSKFCLGK